MNGCRRAGSHRAASADGSAAPGATVRPRRSRSMIISPLTPRRSGCVSRAARPRQSITMPSRSSALTSLLKLDGAAGRGDPRMQLRQHAARLDMAFIGDKTAPSRKRPSSDGSSSANASRVEPPVAGGQPGKAFEIGAVARMRHHQRAVERRLRKMLAPQIERAQAEPADHGLGGFGLAPGRQHAAGPMAGGLRHRRVAALMQRDVVAGLREQQRLPGAGNAGADDGYGGFPCAETCRTLIHPCPFAGMTRIRFKGSPRSRACRTGFELAVSQLLIGAPLGTGLM